MLAVSGAASESSAAPEAVSDDVSENEPSFGEISWDDVSGESSEAVPESEYSVLKRLEGTVAVAKKETDGVTRIGLLENGEPITDFEYDNYRIVMDSTSRYVVLERSDGAIYITITANSAPVMRISCGEGSETRVFAC